MPRPILTQDAQERIENKLLISLLAGEEIMITYYENGYVLTSYMTVVDIDPLERKLFSQMLFIIRIRLIFSILLT